MNIHEYQAKALLAKFGVPLLKGGVAYTKDEAMDVGPQARRPGRGGEGADPCRRPRQGPLQGRSQRQGRRAHREVDRGGRPARRGHAGHDAGHQADRPGRQGRQAPLHRGRLRHHARALSLACWSTAPLGRVTVIASTEGGMDIEEVAPRHPEKIVKQCDRSGGGLPALPGPQDRLRARARGQAGRRVRASSWTASTRPSSSSTARWSRSTRWS